ncbi:coiled-coil and C2 domain-containing protein 2A isoform X2 [Sitophilus oryzae]|uniref:Coiled-coil and C2 domain-containing protein 2A isoform X2 n=1 Tax=Sitophilus oryzae TaxID=7048 RepID=A0A6J2YT05_SITOR|nr:coiled-coil and C2 domain-containing protein 2A isoform X2 [Sitophilus oryzae]
MRNKYPSRNKTTETVGFFVSELENNINTKTDQHLNENHDKLTHFAKPKNLKPLINISESFIHFITDNNPVFIISKIDEPESRNLEEEGLYIHTNSQTPKIYLNILEKRLYSENDRKWFNCDGSLLILPSPQIHHSVKPYLKLKNGEGLYYKYCDHDINMEEVLIIPENILELSLSHVKFFHHPLFSLEHILEQALYKAFKKYANFTSTNKIQKLKNQLEALKHARCQNDSEHFSIKVVENLRENLFKEGKNQRENLKLILNIWRGIKSLREQQGYSTTSVKLLIKKESVNFTLENEEHEKYFSEMLRDVLDEHKMNFQQKMKKYNRSLRTRDISESEDIEETILGQPIYDTKKKKIEKDLRKKFEESFKPPGEPNVSLFLNNDNETSNIGEESENARKKVVSSTKFWVKIYCKGILVCKTKPVSLDDRFYLDINEIFTLQLSDIPKFLTIQIIEQPKGLLKKKICDMNLEVPNLSSNGRSLKLVEAYFEKSEIVHYKHAGVGSGCRFKKVATDVGISFDMDIDAELNTKGCLTYGFRWKNATVENIDTNGALQPDIPNILNKWGAIDRKQLEYWLEGTIQGVPEINASEKPDPQDPKNSPFFEYLNQNDFETFDADIFRLNPYAAEVNKLCNVSELDRNLRLQCLKLRDRNEIEFDGMMVPNRAREISLGPLKDYKRRKALDAIDDDDVIEDYTKGKRKLKQMYTKIFYLCKGSRNNLSYESVVNEKYLFYLEEIVKRSINNFFNWFRLTPILNKPLPKVQEVMQVDDTPERHCKIFVKIFTAKNLPKRKSVDETIRPFLEISHEDYIVKTNVGSGCNPLWNELVELPVKSHHMDYLNPNALNTTISIKVFDWIASSDTDDKEDITFWLGDINIPISALTTGLNMQGWFEIKRPNLIYGYEFVEEQTQRSPRHISGLSGTYLQLNLSISPSVPLLEPNMDELPCNEVPFIKNHILRWNNAFNNNFPLNKFNALSIGINKRTHCITRYIKPLEPPQTDMEIFEITTEQCLNYVSLIPCMEVNKFYQNVWQTTDEMLNTMVGSVIDHCIALTCFLLALKQEVWLLLGFGIPHGVTAYVLICEYDRSSKALTYSILDVVNNKKYSLLDPYCPLQRVFCLANETNVWGNTQRSDNPALLRFDLSSNSDWWPLFDKDTFAPAISINKLNFISLIEDTYSIERQLERKLKKKIAKWRPGNRTIFNHRVSESLKEALKSLEHSVMNGKSTTESIFEISKALSHYLVKGFCINIPFTSISFITKWIKRTCVHNQLQEVKEFALAVAVQNYPGNVLSLWILFATLLDTSD